MRSGKLNRTVLGIPPAIVAQEQNYEVSSNLCLLLDGCIDGVHMYSIYRLG